jgi:hypothetical protein
LAIAVSPLFVHGFPRGHDWTFELVRVAEYQAALASGQVPPHWGENLYAGYGSPVFLFYAPLFSAGASMLGWMLGSATAGACAWLVLLLAVAVWACRGMAACASGPGNESALRASGPGNESALRASGPGNEAAARVAVSVYVLHPYLLGDAFLRNANAELAALCIVPLVVWGALEARERPHRASVLLSGGLGLSILSHNLTALVATALALGVAGVDAPGGSRRRWLALSLGGALGLALAAFFWVPALSLVSWVRTEDLLTGKFDFHRQFPDPATVFGYARFYATGVVTPAVLVLAAVATARAGRGRRRRLLGGALAAAATLLFLATRASTPLWETLPGLPLFQFPWRMLGPLALTTSLAAALSFAVFFEHAPARRRLVAELAVFALCVFNALPVLTRVEPIPEMARSLDWLTPAAVRRGSQSVTVRDEYLPRGADPSAWMRDAGSPQPVRVLSGQAELSGVAERGSRIDFRVESAEPVKLRLARWAFPGWRLEIDGRVAETERGADGAIQVDVPAGEHELGLRRQSPGVRRLGLAVSGLAALAWLALWARRRGENSVS